MKAILFFGTLIAATSLHAQSDNQQKINKDRNAEVGRDSVVTNPTGDLHPQTNDSMMNKPKRASTQRANRKTPKKTLNENGQNSSNMPESNPRPNSTKSSDSRITPVVPVTPNR